MKKFFLFICLSVFSIASFCAYAGVKSIANPMEATQNQNKPKEQAKNITPLIYESQEEFWDDRVEKAFQTTIESSELEETNSFDIRLDDEHLKQLQENQKPFFQKIYEQAINRVSDEDKINKEQNDIINDFHQKSISYQQQDNNLESNKAPNYPSILISINGEEPFVAPAVEHIPYFTSEIELLADGSAKITEKITIVANGDKIKEGISRAFSRKNVARDGKINNVDISIISVKLDNQILDYQMESLGNILKMAPKKNYALEAGIHSYEFEYLVSRQLWEYEDFSEFYWNINGAFWNLPIARIGAMIILPEMDEKASATSFITKNGQADTESTKAMKSKKNIILFTSKRPLFAGEAMQIITSMDKKMFLPVDFQRKISWFISDFGDIILSLLGFVAIFGAYFISWFFISTNKTKQNISIKKNSMILRYLKQNIFDKISFVSFLLDLYGKNIIDFAKENNQISLIRLTDDTKSLSLKEKKAIESLFVNKESVLMINSKNNLKIKRAYNLIFQDTTNKIKNFLLKANLGYLLFSFGMILLVQTGLALLDYSYIKSLSLMIVIDIVILVCIFLFMKNIKSKVWSYIVKVTAIILVFLSIIILSKLMHIISCLMILSTLFVIYLYTIKLSKKNGLIKNSSQEMNKTYEYLKNNAHIVGGSKIFIKNQADIFALGLENEYKQYAQNKDYNKLDIAREIVSLI